MKNNKSKLIFIISLLLCTSMSISLISCGGNTKTTTDKKVSASFNNTSNKQSNTITEVVKVTDKNGRVETNKNGENVTKIISKTVNQINSNTINNTTINYSKTTSNNRKTTTVKKTTAPKATVAETQKSYPVNTKITLSDNSSKASGSESSNIKIAGNTVTIIKKGTYELSGSLSNGQIRVDLSDGNSNYQKKDDDKVVFVLNGVKITNQGGFAVYVDCAKTTVFNSKKGTTSIFKDGGQKNQKAWACIYSDDNITFNGEGSIEVYGNTNNGIYSKNDVKLNGGNLTVFGLQNGIRGDESVTIKSGYVDITAEKGDCIKSSDVKFKETSGVKTLDKESGFIKIEGGNISLKAGDDALQAISLIEISKTAKITVVYKGKVTGDKGKKCNVGYEAYEGEVIGKDYII